MMKRFSQGVMTVAALAAITAVTACSEGGGQTATPSVPVTAVASPTEAAATATMQPTDTPTPEATPTPVLDAGDLQAQFVSVFDEVKGSVVNVTSESHTFDRFLGQVPSQGTGSGFVYDEDGDIVTNYHVIEGADSVIVTLPSGESYTATVVGSDPPDDLAVIKIDAGSDLPPALALASTQSLEVGQWVMAIGHPFGLDETLTVGIISGLGRVITGTTTDSFIGEAIQTDASINPGNSGGPLLNLGGQVIGINSQILSPSGTSAGVGFAISVSTVRRVVPDLIGSGTYDHPWLGVRGDNLTPFIASLLRDAGFDLPVDTGLLVTDIDSGSPAETAGIQTASQALRVGPYLFPANGDLITEINGAKVESLQDITLYLEAKTKIGETVDLTVYRNGEELTVPVTLTVQPKQ